MQSSIRKEQNMSKNNYMNIKGKKHWNIKSPVHAWQQLPELHKEGEKN